MLKSIPQTAVALTDWRDKKHYLWMLGFVAMLLPAIGIQLVQVTGLRLFWWFTLLVMFVAIPVLDQLLGDDASNPPESAVPALEHDGYYRWIVRFAVLAEFVSLIASAQAVVTYRLGWFDYLGVAFSLAVVTGVSINTAHELGHKSNRLERFLAQLALAPTGYGHFCIEHNYGHHKRVATPEDPASSRYGESFWQFYPRTTWGGIVSGWRIETERLSRHGLPAWHWRNEILQSWAMTVVIWASLIAWLGATIVPLLLIQAIYGSSMLEVVNYIEHYGLLRKKRPDGGYERCQPEHSWNSNRRVTNLFLYQLQRHADHHANPSRSYQSLRHFDTAPELPAGYATMLLIAYVPPLWFKIMNPRVKAHYNGDLGLANVMPRAN